jgi:hypothetical protein
MNKAGTLVYTPDLRGPKRRRQRAVMSASYANNRENNDNSSPATSEEQRGGESFAAPNPKHRNNWKPQKKAEKSQNPVENLINLCVYIHTQCM